MNWNKKASSPVKLVKNLEEPSSSIYLDSSCMSTSSMADASSSSKINKKKQPDQRLYCAAKDS